MLRASYLFLACCVTLNLNVLTFDQLLWLKLFPRIWNNGRLAITFQTGKQLMLCWYYFEGSMGLTEIVLPTLLIIPCWSCVWVCVIVLSPRGLLFLSNKVVSKVLRMAPGL